MNGNNIVFDTNALINFFNGHSNLQQHASSFVTLSIISVIEFLSYPRITQADQTLLYNFLKKVQLIELNLNDTNLISTITSIRKNYRLKLPDAIVAATALVGSSTLITNDSDFQKVNSLTVQNY